MDLPLSRLLRVYIDAAAQRDGRPYWEVLLDRAREMGLANAAALQVLDAFGPASVIHGAKARDLAPGRRVILELIDDEPALRRFHESLELSDDTALATLETVGVVGFGGHRHRSADDPQT